MKKVFLSIVLLAFVSSIIAQDVIESTETKEVGSLVSKKGEPFLPESGDWAISFDASPIFTYVGNAFNGNTFNNAPGADFLNQNQTIVGKLFLDDQTAIRALVRIGFGSIKDKELIANADPGAFTYPATPPTVEDSWTQKNTTIGIGGGYELRRGKTRLQGYFGGDAMIWVSSSSDTYEYGNGVTDVLAPQAISTDFGGNYVTDPYGNDGRLLTAKSGMTFGVGVRGFIGAEYFIFPKIAIGAEYGWGIGFESTGKGSYEIESYDPIEDEVGTVTIDTEGGSAFGADTDINQTNIFGLNGSNTGSLTLRATFHF
jgi:hypothetical protein